MGINNVSVPNEHPLMQTIHQFIEAYNAYDTNGLMALHTDDAIWTWIDPGKNVRQWGPAGKVVGRGKQEIQKMFDEDRGQSGYTGWILFSELQGNDVSTVELWQSDLTRTFGLPLVTKSLYRVREARIVEWTWVVSPEITARLVALIKAASEPKSS